MTREEHARRLSKWRRDDGDVMTTMSRRRHKKREGLIYGKLVEL